MLRLSTGETSEMIKSNVMLTEDEKEKKKIESQINFSENLTLVFRDTAFEDVVDICEKQYVLSEKYYLKLVRFSFLTDLVVNIVRLMKNIY
jgi:hypothetical protein